MFNHFLAVEQIFGRKLFKILVIKETFCITMERTWKNELFSIFWMIGDLNHLIS